jgi:hypothetical protein
MMRIAQARAYGDNLDRQVGLREHGLGSADPQLPYVPRHRDVEMAAEESAKRRSPHIHCPGQFRNRKRLVQVMLDPFKSPLHYGVINGRRRV